MKILSSEDFYTNNCDYYETTKVKKAAYMEAVNRLILENFENSPILDVGCGDGTRALNIFSGRTKKIVGLDSSIGMCRKAERNGIPKCFNENIANVSKNTKNMFCGKFGTVICLWNVLGHIIQLRDREMAVKNMADFLGNDGLLFIDVNNRLNMNNYGLFSFLLNCFSWIFKREKGVFELPIDDSTVEVYLSTEREIKDLLEKNGFYIERLIFINYNNGKVEDSWARGQILAICRKKI